MEVKEIAKLIRLNKKKAELEFKKNVLGIECENELKEVSSKAAELDWKLKQAGIEIVYPNQNKLEELAKKMEEYTPEQLKQAMSTKSGEAFVILNERGVIVKANHENLNEVAKLSFMISKLQPEEKTALTNAVKEGKIETAKVESLDEKDRANIAKFLFRCGMTCSLNGSELTPEEPEEYEVCVKLSNKNVWVSKETAEKLEVNLKKMDEIGSKIQVNNAVRHIKTFSEEEENAFTSLQAEYLELLKEQDGLLKEYDGESKLLSHVGA
jgi:hypothetical protein